MVNLMIIQIIAVPVLDLFEFDFNKSPTASLHNYYSVFFFEYFSLRICSNNLVSVHFVSFHFWLFLSLYYYNMTTAFCLDLEPTKFHSQLRFSILEKKKEKNKIK